MYEQHEEEKNQLEWVQNSIFYQIFPDRFYRKEAKANAGGLASWYDKPDRTNFFGGNLTGITAKLGYLEELGVNAVYLNPVFVAATNHRYDTFDYFNIDPLLGTNSDLKILVDEAHKRGIRIVLDGVFNHCGLGFSPFTDVLEKGKASPYCDWFIIDSFPIETSPPNYQTCGGEFYLPKLNMKNPEVQDFVIKVAKYWIEETGIDGWRLDVPWKIPGTFWRTFRRKIKQIDQSILITGEIWRDGKDWLQGDTFDSIMNYQLREYILDFCVRGAMDAEDFAFELERLLGSHRRSAFLQLNLLGSHDTPRIYTMCDENPEPFFLALVFIFTYIGVPMIYYGDEIGMTGDNDPGCRKTMRWEKNAWNLRVNEMYRKLILIRKENPALRYGDFKVLKVFNNIFAFSRCYRGDYLIIVMNTGDTQSDINVPLPQDASGKRIWQDLISSNNYYSREGSVKIGRLLGRRALILKTLSLNK